MIPSPKAEDLIAQAEERLPHAWSERIRIAVFTTLRAGAPGLSDQIRDVLALSVVRKLVAPKPPMTPEERAEMDQIMATALRSFQEQPK